MEPEHDWQVTGVVAAEVLLRQPAELTTQQTVNPVTVAPGICCMQCLIMPRTAAATVLALV